MNEIPLNWYRSGRIFGPARVTLGRPVTVLGTTVPNGFRTDGASLPWFLRAFLSPLGAYFPAALLHDYLLDSGEDRKVAAVRFKNALKALQMPVWLVNSFYAGVRLNDRWLALRGKA